MEGNLQPSHCRLSLYTIRLYHEDIGVYWMCINCQHFMLTLEVAIIHGGCSTKSPPEYNFDKLTYKCSTCARYYDNMESLKVHEELHMNIGDYTPLPSPSGFN